MKDYCVYILSSETKVLYIGVTGGLTRRMSEHQQKLVPGFASKYNVTHLVYYERFGDIRDAIAREKELKGWLRRKKVALIRSVNPNWDDLSEGWFDTIDPTRRIG